MQLIKKFLQIIPFDGQSSRINSHWFYHTMRTGMRLLQILVESHMETLLCRSRTHLCQRDKDTDSSTFCEDN